MARPKKIRTEAHNDMAIRLRKTIDDAGGPTFISTKSGIPLSTLNEYFSAGDLPFHRAIAIAEACDVDLKWLAYGGPKNQKTDYEIPFLSDKSLDRTANLKALIVSLTICREYFYKMGKRITLFEAFSWIGPHYENAQEMPDTDFLIKEI